MSSQLGKARLGSENLSPAPPTPAPRKDGRRTLPSPWLLRWSLGLLGRQSPKLIQYIWGYKTLRRGTGQFYLNRNWKQTMFAV